MSEELKKISGLEATVSTINFLLAAANLDILETIMTEELTEKEYERLVQRYMLRFWDSAEQEKKTREMLEKYRPKNLNTHIV